MQKKELIVLITLTQEKLHKLYIAFKSKKVQTRRNRKVKFIFKLTLKHDFLEANSLMNHQKVTRRYNFY